MKNKVVYILGAGFSKEASAPSQEELVSKIFELHNTDSSVLGEDKMIEFAQFLEETMCVPKDMQMTIPLEDIFTPIDRCIADNISFRNLSLDSIKKKRELVYEVIGKTLEHILRHSEKGYVDTFAKYLVELSACRIAMKNKINDPVSVLSTNWDILLDNSIYNYIQHPQKGTYDAVVDYCCYISSFTKGDSTVKPGLEVLGRGGFNVKLLKLHGSLNWLQCPRCRRLYVEFNEKIAMHEFRIDNKPQCWHCNENFGAQNSSHNLLSNLIMPTFLKDLSNPQYKIIWQNAGIELAEAAKIVFIGYSLPQADYEMRQLLSRMIDVKTEIEVVDYERKDPTKEDFIDLRYKETENRYCQFFGRKVKMHNKGAKDYVNREILPLLMKLTNEK